MSIRLMSAIWENSTEGGSELLLLLAMADMANEDGICWPAYDTLAKKIRKSKRYTIDLVDKLVKNGCITKTGRMDSEGDPTSNMYKVVSPSSLPSEPQITTGSDPQFTGVVIPSSPKSSINHHLNHNLNQDDGAVAPYSVEQKKEEVKPELTSGQRLILASFNSKRFKNGIQAESVRKIEEEAGEQKFREMVQWCAKRGMQLGGAIISMESAAKNWGDTKKPKVMAGQAVTTGTKKYIDAEGNIVYD